MHIASVLMVLKEFRGLKPPPYHHTRARSLPRLLLLDIRVESQRWRAKDRQVVCDRRGSRHTPKGFGHGSTVAWLVDRNCGLPTKKGAYWTSTGSVVLSPLLLFSAVFFFGDGATFGREGGMGL